MSILQEYAAIRRSLGEENYAEIVKFLDNHPEYYLSDVYYKKAVFDQMRKETNFQDNKCSKQSTLNEDF